MPLVKAQCTNCGANLEVDNSKDAAICPFCNTPYVIEKAINYYQKTIDNRTINNFNIPNASIHVKNMMMADAMFENWLITTDEKLKEDFKYYFPTDPRNEYMKDWGLIDGKRVFLNYTKEALEKQLYWGRTYLSNDKYSKYFQRDIDIISNELKAEVSRRKRKKVLNAVSWIIVILLLLTSFLFLNGIITF